MRYLLIIAGLLAGILGGSVAVHTSSAESPAERVLAYFKRASVEFSGSADTLLFSLQALDSTRPATITGAKTALRNCRLHYKRISFFLEFFFPQNAWFYNAPAKYEVEEPFMEYAEPHGLQQIEALLFGQNPVADKTALLDQVTVIRESALTLPSLTYQFTATDAGIMQSLRLELIRIMALYISGYDAPCLQSGIAESAAAIGAFKDVLSNYLNQQEPESRQLSGRIQGAQRYLQANGNFNAFDRLRFLSDYAIPLERQLKLFIEKRGLSRNSPSSPDFSLSSLFQVEAGIAGGKSSAVIRLGRKLFFEKRLSGNNSRSCGDCHQPAKYYTDQISSNTTYDHRARLTRNTPTVLYAAIQSAQFWDGRAKTPADQIRDVLTNPREMSASFSAIQRKLYRDDQYRRLFSAAFPADSPDSITIDQVCVAITGFMKSLMPMNAPFDQYLRGNRKAMTVVQKKGFNLFMGKGQCGTCHFIPFFNGSTPPLFNRSEYEILGVPAGDRLDRPVADNDAGRFSVFPSPYYQSAFKTPTLRNIAKTAPYMHHGRFRSLARVLDFYNRGGGIGLGLAIRNQTLSSKPLHLQPDEVYAIISFLGALTDQLPDSPGARRFGYK